MEETKKNAVKADKNAATAAEIIAYIQRSVRANKNQDNQFGGFKYRNAEGILEALKPVFARAEESFRQPIYLVASDEIVTIGDRLFLKAVESLHIGQDNITATAFAELGTHRGMSSEQCTGSASSYARKYALCALFMIDDSAADPDTMKPLTELEEVEGLVKSAKTTSDLVAVWNRYQHLQSDGEFCQLLKARRCELEGYNATINNITNQN